MKEQFVKSRDGILIPEKTAPVEETQEPQEVLFDPFKLSRKTRRRIEQAGLRLNARMEEGIEIIAWPIILIEGLEKKIKRLNERIQELERKKKQ